MELTTMNSGICCSILVVYDVKDTKFEWNSQHLNQHTVNKTVVYDVKDTKFEWNSQLFKLFLCAFFCCL